MDGMAAFSNSKPHEDVSAIAGWPNVGSVSQEIFDFDSELTESQVTESRSRDDHDSGFYERSLLDSDSFNIPPNVYEIDQWQRHISLQNFAKNIQDAAKSIYPNDTTRSRYSGVYVLIIKWEVEDPKLPVSYEIAELREVLDEIYHSDVEVFQIPESRSHARVSEKINSFVDINGDSKNDLKIVYYAGHGRLSKTRDLVWTNCQNKRNEKCSTVTWTGIQKALEQAQSDVLILLDCCPSGIGDAGEGNGVTELLSACAFDVKANGVGHYSFTKVLTIELRLLSKKRSFPVVELYTHIYCRAQHHMAQSIDNERYPAPIHLLLTRDKHFPRSIQLSIQEPHQAHDTSLLPEPPTYEPDYSKSAKNKRRQSRESPEPFKKRPCLDQNSSSSEVEVDPSATEYLDAQHDNTAQNNFSPPNIGSASNNDSSVSEGFLQDSLQLVTTYAPRLLFAVRLEDNIRAEDLSPEYFVNWLRMIPTIAKEVKIEAGFECNSTLLLISLPLCLRPYLAHHSAVISLGPVKSSNLLAVNNPHEELASTRRVSSHLPELAEDERRAIPVPQSLQDLGSPLSFIGVHARALSPDMFCRELPSPGQPTVGGPFTNFATANYQRPSQSEGIPPGERVPQEMIHAQAQANDHSDTGSKYYRELDMDEVTQMSSELTLTKYHEENGRTYHACKAGRYVFPNDEPEMDRLDLQHHLFTLTFGGKLCVCPVTETKKLHRVLDVGTGTGIWAIEFADVHPEAEVLGIDLSPIQPDFVPPNLKFEIDDLEDPWIFSAKFDFIYARMMTASFKDWPQFFANSLKNLTPGGYLELADICYPIQVDDESLQDDSVLRKWSNLMLEATQLAGSPMNSAKEYKSQLEMAGFTNVVEIQYTWPQNRWPKDQKLKELGLWNLQNMIDGLEGFSMALFIRILGWSRDEVVTFLVAVRKEMQQNSIHAYWVI